MATLTKALVGAGAATSVFALGTGVASAESWQTYTRYTYGGQATCDVWTDAFDSPWPDHRISLNCSIDDTADDGDSIYIDWQVDGFPVHRFLECSVDSDCSRHSWDTGDGGNVGFMQWRVCKNDWPAGDPCSGWLQYYPDGVK